MGNEDSSQSSVAGFHPSGRGFGFDVAPSSAEKNAPATFNTVRQRLVATACWRMNKSLFDFDSSFIKPEISEDLRRLRSLLQGAPNTLASVFGHADPTGNDDYNKELGGAELAHCSHSSHATRRPGKICSRLLLRGTTGVSGPLS
ncbi:MAG: hypothetical protein QM756_02855 [Polyangiaceae bacterium]